MLKLPRGVITERDADRRMGYFFHVHWDDPTLDTYPLEMEEVKLVFDSRARLELGFNSADRLPREITNPRCHQFPMFKHYGTQHFDNVVVRYLPSGPESELRDGLIYCSETAYHFMGRPLLEKLQAEGLTGLFVSKVTVVEDECMGSWLQEGEIVMIDGTGSPFAQQVIAPEEANRCKHCGCAPLMCPECGNVKLNDADFSWICWNCDDIWKLPYKSPESKKKEMRIQQADPFPELFVDVARWNGFDFNAGPLVTWRVVELLERLKCGSLRAEPVAVDVTGLTDEQWKRLEASREHINLSVNNPELILRTAPSCETFRSGVGRVDRVEFRRGLAVRGSATFSNSSQLGGDHDVLRRVVRE